MVTLRHGVAEHERRDRCADTHLVERRCPGDRDCAVDRPPRCHHHTGQRRDVHFRPGPCAVDLGVSHGRGGGGRVLCHAWPAGAGAAMDGHVSDQEVVSGRSPDGVGILSPAVGIGRRHATFVSHDGRCADCHHGRSPRHHLPHPRDRGVDGAVDRAGSPGASELPDVVRRDSGPGCAGGERHAHLVVALRQFGGREGRAVGRPRVHDPDAGVDDRGVRHHALCRVPLPPRHALWRARQPRGDACGLGRGDAGGDIWTACDAIRDRWGVLAADGHRHRLDDLGSAVGRGLARRHRPDAGVRYRPVADGDGRDDRARAAADTAALERRGNHRAGHRVGPGDAPARYSHLVRWPQCRRARQGRPAPPDAHRQGCIPSQGMAGRGRGFANPGRSVADGWSVVRRGRLCRRNARRLAGRAVDPARRLRRRLRQGGAGCCAGASACRLRGVRG